MPKRTTPPSIEDGRRELERLRREIERTEEEKGRLRDENARLKREQDRLRRENERLTAALEAARRAAKRQAAPFSKGAPTPAPRVPGVAAVVAMVDTAIGSRRRTSTKPSTCRCRRAVPAAAGPLTESRVADQVQEELPIVRAHVRRFRVHMG